MSGGANKDVLSGVEAQFEGVYVDHWEIGHFRIETGRGLWGLWLKREHWLVCFPKGFQFPEEEKQTQSRRLGPPRFFRFRFMGIPSEKGRFDHMGICCRNVEALQVLEMSEIKDYKASAFPSGLKIG